MVVKALLLLTALGSKSHLRSFAQVLCQHYEVDQRLRVTAVLKVEERQKEMNRVMVLFSPSKQCSNRNTRVEETQSNVSCHLDE